MTQSPLPLNPSEPPVLDAEVVPAEEAVAAVIVDEGLWRSGNELVIRQGATFPDRCIKCNAPTARKPSRTLAWAPSWVTLLVLLSPVVAIIVYYLIRATMPVQMGVCERHLRRRQLGIILGWSLAGLGAVMIIVAIARESGVLGLIGVVLPIAGLVTAIFMTPLYTISRIEHNFAYLKKVSPDFLNALPALPLRR
jgi:hypothetical protein